MPSAVPGLRQERDRAESSSLAKLREVPEELEVSEPWGGVLLKMGGSSFLRATPPTVGGCEGNLLLKNVGFTAAIRQSQHHIRGVNVGKTRPRQTPQFLHGSEYWTTFQLFQPLSIKAKCAMVQNSLCRSWSWLPYRINLLMTAPTPTKKFRSFEHGMVVCVCVCVKRGGRTKEHDLFRLIFH